MKLWRTALASTLSKKNNEEYLFWLKQTKNANGKLQIKDPEYSVCKTEFLRLLREDFKQLRGKVKLGALVDYKKRKGSSSEAKGESRHFTYNKIAKVSSSHGRVKRSKKGTKLICWQCSGNHSMKSCPQIDEADRKVKYLEEFKRRKEEWKEKHSKKKEN